MFDIRRGSVVPAEKGESPPVAGDSPRASGRLRLYLTAAGIDAVGSGLWMPLGLIFFTRAQHLPVTLAGLAVTAGAAAGLAFGPVSGTLVDRYGPAVVLVASNLLRALSFALYPLATSGWSVAALVALTSAGDRMFWVANAPLLGGLVGGRRLDRLLGTQTVIRVIGLGVGAGAAGLFAGSVDGLHLLVHVNAATFLLAAALIPLAAPLRVARPAAAGEAGPGSGRWAAVLADRPYLALCAVQVLFSLAASSLTVALPLVALDPLGGPVWLPGAAIVLGNVVLATCQGVALRLSERTTRFRALAAGCGFFAVAFAVLAAATALPAWAAVAVVLAASAVGVCGELLAFPLMTAAANESAPEALRGRYSAAFQTAWGVSTVIGPASFTALLAVHNAVLWLALAALSLLAAAVLARLRGRLRALTTGPEVARVPAG